MTFEEGFESLPLWLRPPPQGFVASDLDHLPGLPMHAELIDGSLAFFAPQTCFHSRALALFETALHAATLPELRVRSRITIILDEVQRPEPDLIVIKADDADHPNRTFYRGQDVVLVVEVISQDTRPRDTKRKPLLYAEAGIPHFWLTETQTDQLIVRVHELDSATGAYTCTGVHSDRLKLTVPFDVDIDLTTIDRM
ncbi:Uma2 family endonuclease [Nonomuraea rubra]